MSSLVSSFVGSLVSSLVSSHVSSHVSSQMSSLVSSRASSHVRSLVSSLVITLVSRMCNLYVGRPVCKLVMASAPQQVPSTDGEMHEHADKAAKHCMAFCDYQSV